MQQGMFSDEVQTELTPDDTETLAFAMSGLDEVAGTADDYSIKLVYGVRRRAATSWSRRRLPGSVHALSRERP